ncbi:MAG: response regulator [Bacteroidota bacterium]|nr:response regulator [Bacteroidota bacterium]
MNTSIKNKLLAGFSIILLLLISISWIMSNKLSETNESLKNLVNISSRKINLSNEIIISIMETGRYEKNIILEKDQLKSNSYKNQIDESLKLIDNKTLELEELVDAKGKKIITDFKTIWKQYKIDLNTIILLSSKHEDVKAYNISIDKGAQARDQSQEVINRLVEKNKNDMTNDKIASDKNYESALNLIWILITCSFIIAIGIGYWVIKSVTSRITNITVEAEKIASREYTDEKAGIYINDELSPILNSLLNINESFKEVAQHASEVASGNYIIEIEPRSDKDILGNALQKMTKSLRDTTSENEKHNWLTSGQNQLNEKLRGDQNMEELTNNIITFLCDYVHAQLGAVYIADSQNHILNLSAKYALSANENVKGFFAFKEGLIGQAAFDQKTIFLNGAHDEPLRITSSVINEKPKHLIIIPSLFEGETMGVVEIARLTPFSEAEKEFIHSVMESIGIGISSSMARKKIKQLLEETQAQSEELQSQQEELKQVNEELEEQAQNLKHQQEELQITNEELEEQTQSLEMRNKEIEAAKYDVEQKTKQLEISSKYKSEFLANMSHELRTPLNSLLILSKDLSENKKKNLNAEQIESADIIYKSGCDLLNLINEVLDLSKIEAGKMNLNIEKINLNNLANNLYKNFKHQTDEKHLVLEILLQEDLPESIQSDSQRLDQILKNLMSNAIKFTERGKISVSIQKHSSNGIAISIADTGIGIPEEKQMAIFEAFQQADGGTSRKYGGTGLGLSISRELVKLLNGEIKITSKPGQGSTFTIIIPLELQEMPASVERNHVKEPILISKIISAGNSFYNFPSIEDDRLTIEQNDKVLLIIEDDLKFAGILLKQARQKGFKCIAAATGEDGLLLAEKYKPQAIILDLSLPGIDGDKVLTELKANPVVRHIPVHIISVNERTLDLIKAGAIEYFRKPVDKSQLEEAFNRIENFINRKMKNLLIVEDDANSRTAMRKLIGNGDVKCLEAATGKAALELFRDNHIDCIILDIGLPDISGFTLIYEFEKIKDGQMPPIIVYTGKELTKEENDELQKYTETIIIKGVLSEERLLDETALFLHRTISAMPETKQKIITDLYNKDTVLLSKKVLLVDDDMRNVFALAKVLKERGMEVIKAENGKNALEVMEKEPLIHIVLMDIMMPDMDGYEAMRRIRAQEKYKKLPIIALTAKAMKEDKQKCIDAGANDYISKPVDVDRLFSLMRVWLSK